MLLKILGLLETIIFFILSFLVKKDKNLMVFGCRKGTAIIGNPKIFYKYLQNKYGDKYTLYFYDKGGINTDKNITTYGNTFEKYWIMLRANYIFIDNCSFDVGLNGVFAGKYNVIQTRHGEPIKGIGFLSQQYIERRSSIVLFFEKIEYKNYQFILSNPNTTKVLSGVFNKAKSVIGIGLPRNDLLLHSEILNLMKNDIVKTQVSQWQKHFKKVILLAPTFRETDSNDYFTKEEAEKLNQTLNTQNYLLIIKTHPNETRAFLHEEYSNIINVTKTLNYDATDFTPFVDVVMTDYSSIYIDFLLTERPVIFYQKDLNDYIDKERGLLYEPSKVVTNQTTAYDFQELGKVLENLEEVIETKKYKTDYENLYNIFFKGLDSNVSTCEKLDNLLLK